MISSLWQKILLTFGIAAGAGVGIVTLWAAIQTPEWTVSREIITTQNYQKLQSQIVDIEQWQHWAPWFSDESEIDISEQEGQQTVVWQAGTEFKARLELSATADNTGCEYRFWYKPKEQPSQGSIKLEQLADGKTKVIWTDHGIVTRSLFDRLIVPRMRKVIAEDMHRGLNKLQSQAS